jgi:hypothetical protein
VAHNAGKEKQLLQRGFGVPPLLLLLPLSRPAGSGRQAQPHRGNLSPTAATIGASGCAAVCVVWRRRGGHAVGLLSIAVEEPP